MATRSSFNKNNCAVKRIMQEARELQNDPSTEYSAAPLEDNLFEWHCTLRGAPETEFEGGLYHFRILLPAEYPFRPPSLMMLTPNGRFETHTKLCISFTNYHEELWQPAWGVRTAIIGLQGFFPLKGQAAMGVGSMEAPGSERRRLAKLSRDWVCPQCKIPNHECLPDTPQEGSQASSSSASANAEGGGELSCNTAADIGERSKSIDVIRPEETASAGQGPESNASALPAPSTDARPVDVSEEVSSRSSNGEEATAASAEIRGRTVERQVEIVSVASAAASGSASVSRPPIVLDAAISVLLVLVAALLCRKML